MKKKVVKGILITVGVFLVLAVVEIAVRNIGTSKAEIKKNPVIIENTGINELPKVEEEVTVELEREKLVQAVWEKVQAKEYEALYQMLEPQYQACMFENIEAFQTFLEQNYKAEALMQVLDFNQQGKHHIAILRFQEGDEYTTKPITLVQENLNSYQIIFDDILKITQKTTSNVVYTDVTITTLQYVNEHLDYYDIIFDVENTSDLKLKIPKNTIQMVLTGLYRDAIYQPILEGDLEIAPNKTTRIYLKFPKDKSQLVNSRNISFDMIYSGSGMLESSIVFSI